MQPNVVLINCDDLGYGDLGCYGSKVNDTPHIDRLAAEGRLFTDFYMASPMCTPSRGAMLTGCYPPRIGFDRFEYAGVLFPGSHYGLHPDEQTIASVLKSVGYATKIVGKWHCGDQPEFLPTRFGFDSYFGLPFSNDMGRQAGELLPRHRHLPLDQPLPLLRDEQVIEQQPDQAALTSRYVDEAVSFMRENHTEPFFLYLAHMHVHLPILAPEPLVQRSRNGRYGAAVMAIDWSVGVIASVLEELGLTERTLILFTSDNGSRADGLGGSNGPLRGRKGEAWEGGMRLPLIARWPGSIPAGSRCSELISALDLLPTIATFAGAGDAISKKIDGLDLGDLMRGESSPSPREDFFYFVGDRLEAVRTGRWKLRLVDRDGEWEPHLFDLSLDPEEAHDVSHRHQDVVADLERRLQACREDLGDAVTDTRGSGRRPVGYVEHPVYLTEYDPHHPYFVAEYDLSERG